MVRKCIHQLLRVSSRDNDRYTVVVGVSVKRNAIIFTKRNDHFKYTFMHVYRTFGHRKIAKKEIGKRQGKGRERTKEER